MATIPEALAIAVEHHQAGRLPQAEQIYRSVLQAEPNQPDALHLLGLVAHQNGRNENAIDLIARAIALEPNNAASHNNLGEAYRALGRFAEAAAAYRRALEIVPGAAQVHNNLGVALQEQGQLDRAAAAYRRALEIQPDYAEVHNNLGVVFHQQRKLDEAVACFERAVAVDPGYAEAHHNLANAFHLQGEDDRAARCHRKAIELDPANGKAYSDLANMKRFTDADDREIQRMEELLAGARLPKPTQSHLHFALGKALDDCRQWDRALDHYRQANLLAEVPFDQQAAVRFVDALIETFSRELLAKHAAAGRDDELPIFIVGMPRSATTLVEQIVSSHPAVFGAGELNDMADVISGLPASLKSGRPFPSCATELRSETARRLADGYLGRLRELAPDAERVTDKMPENFLYLGLIALLLPRAKVIHCRRHPLDVCLSCYFTDFAGRLGFAYDLHGLGVYYRQYERLMDHWRSVLAGAMLPGSMFEVDYEDLVEHQEDVSRRLIEFCGLPWHPDCLAPDRNRRVVQTASSWQVRQPIYTRSVGRWKHYEEHLGPLKQALGWPR